MAERVKLERAPPAKADTRWKKGKEPGPGRPKGVANRTTRLLRECVLDACAQVGRDNKGRDGLVGYLKMLAWKHPDLMVSLLNRVLPMQLVGTGADGEPAPLRVELTLPQLQERLKERGLPVAYDMPLQLPTLKRVTNGQGTNGHAQ